MKDIEKAIKDYREFVETCWPVISKLLDTDLQESMAVVNIEDWFQVNWELLVECQVVGPGERLSVYGDGSDLSKSGRVILPDNAAPTHEVWCATNRKEKAELSDEDVQRGTEGTFVKLCHVENDSTVSNLPPWNSVLFIYDPDDREEEIVVPLESVAFEIRTARNFDLPVIEPGE